MQAKRVENFGDSKPRVQPGAKPYLEFPRYDMSKNKYHLIFNNCTFNSPGVRERYDSNDKDALRIQSSFERLGFQVFVYNDYNRSEIFACLEKLSKQDHSNTSCIVTTFLTHGNEGGILWARDRPYFLHDVVKVFEDADPTLFDKPKLFFVQACRGTKLDSGRKIVCENSQDSESSQGSRNTDNGDKYIISVNSSKTEIYRKDVRPRRPHYLIAYATLDGFYAFRTKDGSWFIQELCNALENYYNVDITRILTVVMRNIAVNRISDSPNDMTYHLKKQMPETVNTLTKHLMMTN